MHEDKISVHVQTDVIYTDLSKAIDRLDHELLLQELSDFGLSLEFPKFSLSHIWVTEY